MNTTAQNEGTNVRDLYTELLDRFDRWDAVADFEPTDDPSWYDDEKDDTEVSLEEYLETAQL